MLNKYVYHFIMMFIFFWLAPFFDATFGQSIDYADIRKQLYDLDNTLSIKNPANNITFLHQTLTDHILPSLTPTELGNEKAVLRVPSDLLRVAQSLFLRRLMYPRTKCLMVTVDSPAQLINKHLFLVVTLSEKNKTMTKILDRKPVYHGTKDMLLKMNRHFIPDAQKKLISFESLKKSMNNSQTIEVITRAIKKQSEINIAEYGGFMTIEYGNDPDPLLQLHFVQTQGENFIRKFNAATGDWRKLVQLMKDNPAEFTIVHFQYRSCLKTIELNISEEKKKQRVEAFADLFLYMSKNSYCPDVVRYVTLLSDERIRGYFVGDFHLHPYENDVSYEDKVNSKEQRVLVIIPRKYGFDLADLMNAQPHAPPSKVIQYRRSSERAGDNRQ